MSFFYTDANFWWIGLHSDDANHWVWWDGSAKYYDRFTSLSESLGLDRSGDKCVAIDHGNENEWSVRFCSSDQAFFICETGDAEKRYI